MTDAPPPRLRLRGITRRFGTTLANDGINLDVAPGEIHALLGENGAGKSTLVKIISFVLHPDSGTMQWDGAPVALADPDAARALGIGMVFQHFALFETLTVLENIALGLHDRRGLAALRRDVLATAARFGLAIQPDRYVHDLSVGERQRIEILRCLLQQPRLLILDEPTSVLTPAEADGLFAMLRQVAAGGCSVLYISHKLEEIRTLCDRATVLRGGRVVGTCDPQAHSMSELAEMMIGTTLPAAVRPPAQAPGPVCLSVRGLSLPASVPFAPDLRAISFDLHAGEILGFAGVAGNGQTDLLAALSGEVLAASGSILLGGQPVGQQDSEQRRMAGMRCIPEERLGRGAVAELSLADNMLLTSRITRNGLIDHAELDRGAQQVIDRFRVVASGPGARADSLSGGNLQKTIIGRELRALPAVLLAAHPTWGVDIGATLAIRAELQALAARQVGVLIISEDLGELLELCDRIAVLFSGRLSAPLPVRGLSADKVGRLMGGLTTDDPHAA